MRYLSVCSGIEAATVAWHPLGWEPVAFSEIEAFPSTVLAHHYPDVPNRGDMTKFQEWPDLEPNVLVGGTPCQSFSVAGLRKGLDDPRGNLMLTYLAIAHRYRPQWLVWENVPGVLSSNNGRDFASLLRGLAELGYGWAYRILDAQHFGVPQRRRRVFVVGCLGSWQRAAAVLFERASLSGHPAPRRETRARIANSVACGLGDDGELARSLTACNTATGRLDANENTFITHSLRASGFDASEDGTGRGTPLVPCVANTHKASHDRHRADVEQTLVPVTVATLTSNGDAHSGYRDDNGLVPVAFNWQASGKQTSLGANTLGANTLGANTVQAVAYSFKPGQSEAAGGFFATEEFAPTLQSQNNGSTAVPAVYIGNAMQVRRLTPREFERLQGFADDYTLIPYRNKPAADGPRYKALGNSMAVPVMAWIGKRIAAVNAIE